MEKNEIDECVTTARAINKLIIILKMKERNNFHFMNIFYQILRRKKKMARGSRYNIVKDKIHVGMKSFGWKCKELYPSHNLWERNAKTPGYIIRECFPKNGVPNSNANYNVLD